MAAMVPFYSYKETRLNFDSTTQESTISFNLPAHGASTRSSKRAQNRFSAAEATFAEDEGQYRQKYLATASSIYHRQHHKSPRSFLWRVLEDGKVLSIQSADISTLKDAPDYNLTLRFAFQDIIQPGCIALSDSEDHDVLSVFVLTETKHLYTLTLRPDYFRRASSTEDNVDDWCKSHYSHAFSIKTVHRMVALSADELLLSTNDGALLSLKRKSGGDGSEWKDSHHNEGSFRQNLRNLISFQGTNAIKFGKANLELPTATSIASPTTIIGEAPYTFMVSLDHKLRIWNLLANRLVFVGDILGYDTDSNDTAKPVIDPSYSQLVKVYSENEQSALCVTYSPLGKGQFKFWGIAPGEEGNLKVSDIFPRNTLVPQTPTSNLWTLADFAAVQDRSDSNHFLLWVLWKNNTAYRVQKLDFESRPAGKAGIDKVRAAWESEWEAMAPETLRDAALPTILSGDHADGTDKWLEFIFAPGRFTAATIETGLIIYERGLGVSKSTGRRAGSIEERMCSIIASAVTLGRKSDGDMDNEQFRVATDTQWRRFYRLLRELDKQRGEALSLAVDPQGHMPWVVLADGVTAVRECSALEQIWHNQEAVPPGSEHIASLVTAAAALRDTFSEQMLHNCTAALREEIFEETSLIPAARMRAFYEKCDFANQIGDEEYGQLQSNLGGTFKDVTPQVYHALLQMMSPSIRPTKKPQLLPNTQFGNKLILQGVQETVELHRSVCLAQLFLLILIEAEINHGEEGTQFDTSDIFTKLLFLLTRLELISYLASRQISFPLSRERSTSITEKDTGGIITKPTPNFETVTILEANLRHLYGFDVRINKPMPQRLTANIINICSPLTEIESPPALTQCFLLKHGRPDLAMELSRFADRHPFDVYVQGRACLASGDVSAASALFKKAAYGIASTDPRKSGDQRTAGLLDEMERNSLNAGMPQYYSHIVALYEKEKIYSFIIDFARLALQFIPPGHSNLQLNQLRTEMHSRLFNAAVQTSRYDLAHSVLALFTDSAIQHSSLRTLITKMCESSFASQLISLPFLGLQDAVDEVIAQKCQSIVDVLAGVPYHKILYSWRIKRSDFRGAAAISYERLQRLLVSGEADRLLGEDGLETPVTQQYLSLINALSCVEPKQAWILSEELPKKTTPGLKAGQPKRKVVTLEDIRKSYQDELDRIAAIENNQFAFAGGEEMEVDML